MVAALMVKDDNDNKQTEQNFLPQGSNKPETLQH
jgi:hypothetical protein